MAQRRATGRGRQTSNKARNVSDIRSAARVPTSRQRKLHSSPNFVQDELADPGPWIPVASSRMTQIRYDYGLRAIFVQFTSGIYWVYESVPYALWYRFYRSASKGKFINRQLNGYPYREASPEEALRPTTHGSST